MTVCTITVADGAEAGKTVALGDVLTIGRLAENDLVLIDAAVSRRHARIVRRSGGMFIEDLDSAHGTTVNGERIRSREIKPGDLIGIGQVSLRLSGGAAGDAAPDATDILLVRSTHSPSHTPFPSGRPGSTVTKDPAATAARFEAIVQVGLMLQSEREISKLLERIAKTLVGLLDVDRCGIFLSGNAEPEVVFSREGLEDATSLPFSKSLLSRAMDAGEALVTADAGRDQRLAGASLAAGTLRSAMVAPLWGRERVLGAAVVENRGKAGAFDSEDLRLLSVLATLAGTAIENVRLIGDVRHEAEERAALSRFFSPAVADEVRRHGLSGLRGGRRAITVLFTDIRGFTSLSETLPPDDLIESLNRAFGFMTESIFSEHGTVDKFTGDGMLAFFGAPIDQPDHAERALRAARMIVEKCRDLKTSSGHPLPVGIGIATGEAMVGPVGPPGRMEYTVIGDVVNIAARLVAQAAGGEILMTESAAQAAGAGSSGELLGSRQIKGRKEQIRVYKVT